LTGTQRQCGLRKLRVTVTYAPSFEEEVGTKEETYEIDQESIPVGGILELIAHRHGAMKKFVDLNSEEAQRRRLIVALNSRLARLTEDVHNGDKVSLLLPVLGGCERGRKLLVAMQASCFTQFR